MLVGQRARYAALGVAVALPIAAATLLSGVVSANRVSIHSTVQSNFRGSYDLLVRPAGARSSVEQRSGLVRPDYLDGVNGGITLSQWREILKIGGVAVAAPIQYLGYVFPGADEEIPLRTVLPHPKLDTLYRVSVTPRAHHSLDTWAPEEEYVLVTDRPSGCDKLGLVAPAPLSGATGPPSPDLNCYAPAGAGHENWYVNGALIRKIARGARVISPYYSFPFLVAAIDPVQENKLVHLGAAMTSGSPLAEDDSFSGGQFGSVVPVIASDRSSLDEDLRLSASAVAVPSGANLQSRLTLLTGYNPANGTANDAYHFVHPLRSGPVLGSTTVPTSTLYRQALNSLAPSQLYNGEGSPIEQYLSISQVRYRQSAAGQLIPRVVANDPSVFDATTLSQNEPPPLENTSTSYRKLTAHNVVVGPIKAGDGTVALQGAFDPNKVTQGSDLAGVSMDGYYPPDATAGNAATKSLLGGADSYGPTRNLGDIIAAPPLMLTTLQAARGFTESRFYTPAGNTRAPISAVRVRVAGITTFNQHSYNQMSAVAAAIVRRTGLAVDVVAGSSPAPQHIQVSAGAPSHAQLDLTQGWSKKGADLVVLSSIDHTTLALIIVLLLLGVLLVATAATTILYRQRRQIALLACLGWRPRTLIATAEAALAVVGILAGLVATGLAYAIAALAGLPIPDWVLWVATPVALILVCTAAAVPAWRIARLTPITALQPVTALPRRAARRHVRGVARLGLANLRRAPLRALVGTATLAITVAAATVLNSIGDRYHSDVSGTLLGDFTATQAHTVQRAAIAVLILLGALALANLAYLALMDRRRELATLRATGWNQRALRRLLASETGTVIIAGCLLGALIGTYISTKLSTPASHTIATALILAAAELAACTIATALPLRRITHAELHDELHAQ